jgi:hypothetical protein
VYLKMLVVGSFESVKSQASYINPKII